jgi:hypothetical protein
MLGWEIFCLLNLMNIFVYSFPISISNIHDLYSRQFEKELYLSMELSSLKFVSMKSIENLKIGILKNGQLCHLFDENIYKLKLFLPKECVTSEHFLFSIYLELKIGNEKKYATSLPISVPSISSPNKNSYIHSKITLILPLTFDDLSRAYLLLNSLTKLSHETVHEMIILTPDLDYHPVSNMLSYFHETLSFPLHIFSESVVLPSFTGHPSPAPYPYAIQMALKILISKIISTSFYVTLDADVLLIHSFNISTILFPSSSSSSSDHPPGQHPPGPPGQHPQSLFQFEHKDRHPSWWIGSQNFLQISSNYFSSPSSLSSSSQGFSVTPAILSTYGSLLLLERIHFLFLQKSSSQLSPHPSLSSEDLLPSIRNLSSFNDSIVDWISSFGLRNVIWSEYTLYRLLLDFYHVLSPFPHLLPHLLSSLTSQIFDTLHFPSSGDSPQLHCCDIWFPMDIPQWSHENSRSRSCLFNVLQSSSGIRPRSILEAIQNERT